MRAEAATPRLLRVCTRRRGMARRVEAAAFGHQQVANGRRGCYVEAAARVHARRGWARHVEAAAVRTCTHRAEQAAAARLLVVCTRRGGRARLVEGRCLWAPAGGKCEPRRPRRGCCSCACGDVEGRDTLRLLLCAHAGIERSRRRRRGCCSCACGDLAARDDGGVRGGSGPIDRQVDDHALKQALARAVASWGGGRDTESTRRGTRIQVGGLIRASMDGRQRKYRSGQANIGVVAM